MSQWNELLGNQLNGNLNSVTDITTGMSINYAELLNLAVHQGNRINLPPKSVISVVLPNSVEFIAAYLMCSLFGYIFAPLPYFLTKLEIEKVLKNQKSEFLITSRNDIDFNGWIENVTLNQLGRFPEKRPNLSGLPKIKESDPMALYYSSGTTGSPKGILFSHENQFHLIKSITSGFNFGPEMKHLAILPFGHTASLNYSLYPSLSTGANLFIASGFESIRNKFFQTLSDFEITYVQIVPTIAQALIKLNENIDDLNLSYLKYVGCGSAPLATSVQREFQHKFRLKLANLYGLSETGPSHFDDPTSFDWKPGSIGKPLDVNECKIALDGEILLKGPNVMLGYFDDKELTETVIRDGWFHTGDFGKFIDGNYFFHERKKDLIIVAGINVYPSEIEDIIYQDSRVLECVAFGVPDQLAGEKIVVALRTDSASQENRKNLIDDLYALCRSTLSPFKLPKSFFYLDSFPKTPAGKLIRQQVKAQFEFQHSRHIG